MTALMVWDSHSGGITFLYLHNGLYFSVVVAHHPQQAKADIKMYD